MRNDPGLSLFISQMGGYKPFLPEKMSLRGSEVRTERCTNEKWVPAFSPVKEASSESSLGVTVRTHWPAHVKCSDLCLAHSKHPVNSSHSELKKKKTTKYILYWALLINKQCCDGFR